MTELSKATELIAQALFLNSPHRRNVPPGHLSKDWWVQIPPSIKRRYLSDAEAVLNVSLPSIEAATIAKERERWEAEVRERLTLDVAEGLHRAYAEGGRGSFNEVVDAIFDKGEEP